MSLINETNPPDRLNQLRRSVAGSGFSTLLGAEPVLCRGGEAELVIVLDERHRQHHGFVHGGVIGTAADNAAAWAAASVAGDVVTSNYTLHLLAPAMGTRLRARGRVIKAGKRQLTVAAEVFVEGDDQTGERLVATALASVARVVRA